MSFLNQEWAVAQCAELFARTHCESVANALVGWLDGDAMGQVLSLVVAVLSLVVTVKALSLTREQMIETRRRHEEERNKEAEEERERLKVAPKNSVDLRHCEGDELQALRKWFLHLQVPPAAPEAPTAVAPPLSARVVAEVNADRHFSVGGSLRQVMTPAHRLRLVREGVFRSEYAVEPGFLSWADNGEEILVACDSTGARRYAVLDKGLRLVDDRYSDEPVLYGRGFDRAWCRWSVSGVWPSLCYANDGVTRDLVVQMGRAEPLFINLTQARQSEKGTSVSVSVGGLDAIWLPGAHDNPWRPGRGHLLLVDSEGRAENEGGARALSVFDVAKQQKVAGDIGSHIIYRYELDHVLPFGHYVQGYAWHHSGHFVAVASSQPSHERTTRRVMVFDQVKGRVLASSAWERYLVGWLPGSGQLLLGCTASDLPSTDWRFTVWDPVSERENPLAVDDAAPAVRRMMLSFVDQRSRQTRERHLNADAQLWLDVDGGRICVSPVGAPGQELAIPHEGHAAWSPTDPGLFASVGRIDGKAALRLWRVAGAA